MQIFVSPELYQRGAHENAAHIIMPIPNTKLRLLQHNPRKTEKEKDE